VSFAPNDNIIVFSFQVSCHLDLPEACIVLNDVHVVCCVD